MSMYKSRYLNPLRWFKYFGYMFVCLPESDRGHSYCWHNAFCLEFGKWQLVDFSESADRESYLSEHRITCSKCKADYKVKRFQWRNEYFKILGFLPSLGRTHDDALEYAKSLDVNNN